MDPVFTLPAEAFVQTNGSPLKPGLPPHPLAGNSVWAVGHLPDSTAHTLHFFSGVKGGTFQWHTFRTPRESAEEVELELAFEGSLGLRMDQELFLGAVQSVTDAAISWARAALACRDFQLGRDCFCHRQSGSDTFLLTQIEQLDLSRELPPPPGPPDCYCLSSRDELLLLSGPLLLVLSPPYSLWTTIETAPPPRPLLSFFAPAPPPPARLCLSRGHLCALSRDGETLSLLSLVPGPSWRRLQLPARARQICPVSGPSLSFLIVDRHFLLSRADLDAGSLRPLELPPAFLPPREVLSSVRAIRSLFDSSADSLSPVLSPVSSAPPPEPFYTAGSPGPLEMELDPVLVPSSADPPYSSADPAFSVPSADPYSVPSADPVPLDSNHNSSNCNSFPSTELPLQSMQSADPLITVPSADHSYSVPSADWLLSDPIFSNNFSEVRTGSKRPKDSDLNSPRKLPKSEPLAPSADSHPHMPTDTSFHTGTFLPEGTPGRTSEERRAHKRLLLDSASPCPLTPYYFLLVAHNVSHFEELLEDAISHAGTITPIEQVQGVLFEQEFDFSLARAEKETLSRLFPAPPPRPESPPPPSAPPTVPYFQL